MCWSESLSSSSLTCWLDSPWISSLLSGLVGALVGGFIAGYFSLRAVKLAHKHTLELEEKKQARLIDGYLQGIHDEVETLYVGFEQRIGADLDRLQNAQPLLTPYPVPRSYLINSPRRYDTLPSTRRRDVEGGFD
jgi:hypothetical protein